MIRQHIAIVTLAAFALVACGTGPGSGDASDGSAASTQDIAIAGSGPFEDCYQQAAFGTDLPVPGVERELFVIIDQTTPMPSALVESLSRKVAEYLAGGSAKITVASFSANTASNFATVNFTGEAQGPVDESKRNDLNARKLAQLETCLAQMPGKLAARTDAEMRALVSTDGGSFASSEILGSLTALSEAVLVSQARDKTVLVVSDMLEHSSTTSFYADKSIRDFDVGAELQKAVDRRQLGDFGGAKVYVMGAGLLPPDSDAAATRDAAQLYTLKNFWQNWFENSNASLAGFGQPELISSL
ncbi:hypothetical protein [Paraurantiacibacter namhicola]|uniref:VWFA domain-containing protein n=1 Tax=Paraurantiacibacter namhicola TaxID=645517 RepID=A0A1C7D826_9SPHN|nr:hypothetical protein [Paraurantiacibacter namhicola]ANU07595.1 hypothetical protein A6F65_01289 [Paraurantiacibacter namhicola]